MQHWAVLTKTLLNCSYVYFLPPLSLKIVKISGMCRFGLETACSSLQHLILSHQVAFDLCTSAPALYNVRSLCTQQGVPFLFSGTRWRRKYKILFSIINNGKKKFWCLALELFWHINIMLQLCQQRQGSAGSCSSNSLQLLWSGNGVSIEPHWNCFPHPHLLL